MYMNYKVKSCGGLSIVLVLNWIIGNVFKIAFYMKTEAPIALVLALCYQ